MSKFTCPDCKKEIDSIYACFELAGNANITNVSDDGFSIDESGLDIQYDGEVNIMCTECEADLSEYYS